MAAAHNFLLHGLVVASELDLQAPRTAARAPDISYRLDLGAALPASAHTRADDPEKPWAIEHWLEGRLAVEFPGRAMFEVSRRDVALVRDECNDPDLLLHLFLHHVLPRAIALRGDLMLHAAAAVSPAGRAYLFLASAGTGKSTLVTGLVADGWLLLDDDGVRLTRAGDEGFIASPGSAHVGLLPEVAAALVPELEPGPPIARGSPKRRFALDGVRLGLADAPVPVAGLFVLRRGEEVGLSRLGFATALGEIARHGFHLADDPAVIPRQVFEQASELAAATPVWELVVPAGFDQLGSIQALITETAATG